MVAVGGARDHLAARSTVLIVAPKAVLKRLEFEQGVCGTLAGSEQPESDAAGRTSRAALFHASSD
jgi:hypothetical protein